MPNYNNVPAELRERPQWICWKYEQTNGSKPTKVPYVATTGLRADITNRSCWSTFDIACACASQNGYAGIGFCLSRDDEFVFIDLDNPENDPQLILSHNQIYNTFAGTYAELSPSGTGIHIIGKGSIPTACKRHKVELYAFDRYMTVTGDVLNNAPISDVQPLLWQLYADMGGKATAKINDIPQNPETRTDDYVWANAANAENGALFQKLWSGDWSGYASQSEADLALIDFLQFHSGNIDQIARMFRMSGLGQREKASRDDYVFGMVAKSFDRAKMTELPPTAEFVEAKYAEVRSWQQEHSEDVSKQLQPFVRLLPQGIIMDIADYIYNSAPYPMAEGAIMGAMALLNGIAGRAYNVSGDVGLNQYLLLLAKSGSGKEAVKDGVDRILNELKITVPSINRIIGPATFSSGQAIIKHMAEDQRYCVFSIFGEFGHMMHELSFPHNNVVTFLRKVLLDIYAKNGRGKVLGEMAYSDRGKNTAPISSPSLTILGEAEPIGFLNALDKQMIEAGLLPRFLVVEHESPPVDFNENRLTKVPASLLRRLEQLAQISFQIQQQQAWVDMAVEPAAKAMLDEYRRYTRKLALEADEVHISAMWSRSHMRAFKLAGTAALTDPVNPVITLAMAEWAVESDRYYVETFLQRVERGEIGDPNSEQRQEQYVYDLLARYVVTDYENLKAGKDRIKPEMKRDLVVSHAYIHNNLRSTAPFKKPSHGYAKSGYDAISLAIKKLIDAGDLSKPLNDAVAEMTYGSKQLMYKIANPTAILNRGKQK